jgi:hypothetical protein
MMQPRAIWARGLAEMIDCIARLERVSRGLGLGIVFRFDRSTRVKQFPRRFPLDTLSFAPCSTLSSRTADRR